MTDPREPIAAIKARSDEAQGQSIEIKPIPFYAHPQLGVSVSLIGFRGNTPLYAGDGIDVTDAKRMTKATELLCWLAIIPAMFSTRAREWVVQAVESDRRARTQELRRRIRQ